MSDPIETDFVVAFYNYALTPGSKWLKQGYRHVVTYQPLGRDEDSKRFEWIKEQRRGRRVDRSKVSLEHSDLPRYLKGLNPAGGVVVLEIEQRTPGWFQIWFPQPGGSGTAKSTLGIAAWGLWTPWDLARYAKHHSHIEAVRALRWEKLRRVSLAGVTVCAIVIFAINNFVMPDLSMSRSIEASVTETKKQRWNDYGTNRYPKPMLKPYD